MFLFSRVATLQGPPADTIGWATEMNEFVNSKGGSTVALWQDMFGSPLGTLSWHRLVKSRAELAEMTSELMMDAEYHRRVSEVMQYLGPVPTRDYLRKYVAGTPSKGEPAIGSVAEMVTASPAPGRLADAMAWGPEIALKVGNMVGHSTSFYTDAYGTFGQVTWITFYPDFAAVDEAQDTLMNDEEYLGEVAKGSDLFNAGSGQRGLSMRLA